ncbi:MAG: (2Fe-2S) ferredoxin domain-containing protein [Oscillospiraceae bacterium]
MTVEICIGSSCHLKGSHQIIELMRETIKKSGLEDKVELKAAFCLGNCSIAGVSVKVGDEIVGGITKENFPEFFEKYIAQAV